MNVIHTPPVSPPASSMAHPEYSNEVQHSIGKEIAKYAISLFIVGLGVGAFLFLRSLAQPPETQKSTSLIQQVNTFEVQPYSGLLDLVVTGTVVPHREIKMAAEVGGRVVEKYPACEAGNYVTRGEPLVRIDDEEYQLEIKTLEAELKQSQKRIEENLQQIFGEERNVELARVDLQLQQKEMERNRRLSNVLSQSELDQSQRALNSAQTQLATRENNLATLRAGTARLSAAKEFSESQLDKAKLNLRRTLITAPGDGVIVQEIVQEGDYVTKGTHIVTFEDTRKSEILCNLTPADLAWIRDNSSGNESLMEKGTMSVYQIPKTDVTIFDPADPAVSWSGTLERFDGIGRDEITKTIRCRIVVDDPIVKTDSGPRALVRGMFVKCRVEVQTTSDKESAKMLSFPAVGLHPNNHVWTVKDDKLKRINVDVIDRSTTVVDGEDQEIVIAKDQGGTLRPGDSIVVSPLSQPTVGATVLVK